MSRPSTVDVALDRLAQLELGEDVGVESVSRRGGAGVVAPAGIEQPEVGRLGRRSSAGRRSAGVPRAGLRAPGRRASPRCSGGPSVSRSSRPSATRDPPQLVGARDRGAEVEPAAVGRRDERRRPRRRSRRWSSRSPGIRSCARRQVAAAARRRVGAVRGEQPDVVAAAGPARPAGGRARRSSGRRQPRRRREHRARPARDRGHDARLDVDDVDVLAIDAGRRRAGGSR